MKEENAKQEICRAIREGVSHFAADIVPCSLKHARYAGASLLQYGVEGGSLDIVKLLLSELQASSLLKLSAGELSKEGITVSSQQSEESEYGPQRTPPLALGEPSSLQDSQDPKAEHVQSVRDPLSDGKAVSSGVCNPVHIAALKGFSDLVPSLLGAGFSASAPDAYKRTPLHYAAMKGFAFFPAHTSGAQPPASEPASRPHSGEHSAQHGQHGQVPGDVKPEGAGPQQQPSSSQAHAEECLTPGYTPSCSGDSEHSYTSQGSPAPLAAPKVVPAGTTAPLGAPPSSAQPYAGTATLSYGSQGMPGVSAPHPYSAGLPAPAQYYGPRATVAYGLTADLLIEAGANADAIDMWGCSALHYAAGVCQLLAGDSTWCIAHVFRGSMTQL